MKILEKFILYRWYWVTGVLLFLLVGMVVPPLFSGRQTSCGHWRKNSLIQRHLETAVQIYRLDYDDTPPDRVSRLLQSGYWAEYGYPFQKGRFVQEWLPLGETPEAEYWLLLLTPPWYSRDFQIREAVRYSPDGTVQARPLLKNMPLDFTLPK